MIAITCPSCYKPIMGRVEELPSEIEMACPNVECGWVGRVVVETVVRVSTQEKVK